MSEGIRNDSVFNNSAVRINNRLRVLRFLHESGSATQTELRGVLNLSGPTVIQTLQQLREIGLVEEGESMPSQGGRKPKPMVFRYDAWHSAGVEVRRRHVDVRVLNLGGDVAAGRTFRLPYTGDDAYWKPWTDSSAGCWRSGRFRAR